ncbi:RadC family protein [Alphaproteobacteria bacterium endosymbiont of Tiliacea citrago]|uniref:RadC family protein n=1 Tax=Alphaproteobacteria bacterium endosymbiont of Tiliacea citrago TaxID=3077944 RepID=UPI00313CF198
MDLFNFFKSKKVEELNELEFKVSDNEDVVFFDENTIENKQKTLKNDQKMLKKRSKTLKNDSKFEKKHYEGHRQRLKEKIIANEIEQMPDYEILECLLMYSIPRNDVKPLAKNLLEKFKNLKNIMLAPVDQFLNIKGVGENTLCFFKVLKEIYCRFEKVEIIEEISMKSPDKVAVYCQSRMGHLKHEQFRVLFLNKKNKLIKDLILQNGTIDKAAIFPRELVLLALQIGAGGMILVHNHPSGDPTPSDADIQITKEIKNASNLMNILVYDHLIIAKNAFYSMKAHKIF